MFCPKCRCEFVGWTKCPDCQVPLVKELLPDVGAESESVSYEALVKVVRENGGQLEIDVTTTDVGMERERGFPYQGYKFAWAARMQGAMDGNPVDLGTTEVGKEKENRFPYRGYGFAWVRRMEGYIGGNKIVLVAKKVFRERSEGFPYQGYGFSWTKELSGQCGEQLAVRLEVTSVRRKKGWGFPYRGYGSAWEERGVLTLTLVE